MVSGGVIKLLILTTLGGMSHIIKNEKFCLKILLIIVINVNDVVYHTFEVNVLQGYELLLFTVHKFADGYKNFRRMCCLHLQSQRLALTITVFRTSRPHIKGLQRAETLMRLSRPRIMQRSLPRFLSDADA